MQNNVKYVPKLNLKIFRLNKMKTKLRNLLTESHMDTVTINDESLMAVNTFYQFLEDYSKFRWIIFVISKK